MALAQKCGWRRKFQKRPCLLEAFSSSRQDFRVGGVWAIDANLANAGRLLGHGVSIGDQLQRPSGYFQFRALTTKSKTDLLLLSS
jgi:hypothetical protein